MSELLGLSPLRTVPYTSLFQCMKHYRLPDYPGELTLLYAFDCVSCCADLEIEVLLEYPESCANMSKSGGGI